MEGTRPGKQTVCELEHGHRNSGFSHQKKVIFHSYLSFPEGNESQYVDWLISPLRVSHVFFGLSTHHYGWLYKHVFWHLKGNFRGTEIPCRILTASPDPPRINRSGCPGSRGPVGGPNTCRSLRAGEAGLDEGRTWRGFPNLRCQTRPNHSSCMLVKQ